jgi:hypothetical protein
MNARLVGQQSEDFQDFDIPVADDGDGPIVDSPVYNVAERLALDIPVTKMLIEDVLSEAGCSLAVGPPKSGKTLLV